MPTIRQQQAFLYPLIPLAGAFSCGIVASRFVATGVWIVFAGIWSLAALGGFSPRFRKFTCLLLIGAFFFSGATLASLETRNMAVDRLKRLLDDRLISVGEPIEVTGVLEREPEFASDRVYLTLYLELVRIKTRERKASGTVELLTVLRDRDGELLDRLDLRYGARVRAMINVARADNYRNPGVSSLTEYLDRRGYDATGFLKSLAMIERLDDTRVFVPLAWLYEWRRTLQAEIDNRFSSDTAGVLDAALLGNRHNLSQSTSERFREGGTFHVLVISGLHITFLGGLILLLARRLTRNRLLQFLLSISVLWGYAVAVGAESSVVRAALMFSVVMLAPVLARRATSLNALGGVAIALLIWRPSDLFDPSFQLTFISVLAIVVLALPLLERLTSIGSWRPTRETPYPPVCGRWLTTFSEALFWSDRKRRRELERANYTYRLFKTPAAAMLERARCQRVLRYVFSAIVVSISVQVALLPFMVIYFHRLSVASVFLNIGVSALMGIGSILALVAVAIWQLSPTLAAPLLQATDTLTWLMVHSVDPFAHARLASVRLPEYHGWALSVYALYYIPLGLLTRRLWRWNPFELKTKRTGDGERRTIGTSLPGALFSQLLVSLLIVIHPGSDYARPGNLRVDFLDVGQGDSALVTMPDNTTILIDGGGQAGPRRSIKPEFDDETAPTQRDKRSIGESVVSEYLWSCGLDHVDYLIATHADADHIDGLNDVVRNFQVRAAFVARTPALDPEYSKFANTVRSMTVPLQLIGGGDEMRVGNASIQVLWPAPDADTKLKSSNNDSIVLALRFGRRSILLTGDIENRAEASLLAFKHKLEADVVKVPHHGSKTSSTGEFVRATSPMYAVISVGQTSVFGHPNAEVVDRWKAIGARVLTTGSSGTITVSTDGENLNLETFVK
jgi:competence protein ComEC